MKLSLVFGVVVLLSFVSLSFAGGYDDSAFSDFQPAFHDIGPRSIISDFEGNDEMDLLIGFINPVIFGKIGDPRTELLPLCPDVEKIVTKVEAAFDQQDFKNICSDVENSAGQCENTSENCEDLKKIASGGQATTCPPDEAKFFNACKARFQEQLTNADALGTVECEQLWNSHTNVFFEQQCTIAEAEDVETEDADVEQVETEQAATAECPEPFKQFVCPDGSPAQASGQSYPFDHNDLTCELYTCSNQTIVQNTTVAEECPGPPTCNVGAPVLSGSFQKASGQICPAYDCVQQPDSTTVNATSSPALVSGFAVKESSGVAVASTGGVCNKEGFIDYCVNEFRKKVQYAADNADEDCRAEAQEFTDYLLDQYCEENEVGDPYEKCVEQSEQGCKKIKNVFNKCKSVANIDGLREVVEQKARVECARLALSKQEDEYDEAISVLESLEIESVSVEDAAQLSATRDKIVLSAEELERLKQDIRADVLRDLLTLLGLNTERLEVAKKQRQEIESLEAARGSVEEICGKVTEEGKAKCDALLESLEEKIASLKLEAVDNEAKGSGLLGIIIRIISGK